MKHILVINPHSFVDVITNSSSELFICDVDKSVEAVKEIANKITAFHNEMTGRSLSFFEDMAQEPTVAKYDFDYYDFSETAREEYEKYHDIKHDSVFYADIASYLESDEYKLLDALDDLAREESDFGGDLYEKDKEEYERRRHSYFEKTNEIWKAWSTASFMSECALFIEWLTLNGLEEHIPTATTVINDSEIRGKFTYNTFGKEEYAEGSKESEVYKLYQEFDHYLSWGMRIKKGNIFIQSKDDNSIDYQMFDVLDTYLNATHYHLG